MRQVMQMFWGIGGLTEIKGGRDIDVINIRMMMLSWREFCVAAAHNSGLDVVGFHVSLCEKISLLNLENGLNFWIKSAKRAIAAIHGFWFLSRRDAKCGKCEPETSFALCSKHQPFDATLAVPTCWYKSFKTNWQDYNWKSTPTHGSPDGESSYKGARRLIDW
jgi:hypothetical protein